MTSRFREVWFRPHADHRLGSVSFAIFWFSLFLLPVFMIVASTALVILFFTNYPLSWETFRLLWIINAICYVFITTFTCLIDTETSKVAWREAIMFPGLISLTIILYTCFPKLFRWALDGVLGVTHVTLTGTEIKSVILFAYCWLSLCMLVAYMAKKVEHTKAGRWLSPFFVYIAGYGPLLCAVTLTSYIYEMRGAEMKWEKTEKTGKIMG